MTVPRYTKRSLKALSKMNERQAHKIRHALLAIADNKECGLDIKRLKGTKVFRLRVGKYRAEYQFSKNRQYLMVKKIGSRGGFYK